MKAFVGVTDQRWYEFLAARPDLTEVNFWIPGGGPKTFGLASGEPLLFKTHHPHNRLVGGGFLSDYRQLPIELAWSTFGEGNGVASFDALRSAIEQYRHRAVEPSELIGCAMLRDVQFVPPSLAPEGPEDFAKNIVQFKGYQLGANPDSRVETTLQYLLDSMPASTPYADDERPMFGAPRLVAPRLGQEAFKASVAAAYDFRCAVTGAKIRPALQAAHIRPVSEHGQHRVDNGLLLRADVHIMFDEGYLGVHPSSKKLLVSKRLKNVYGNGEEFYARAGTEIARPLRRHDQPASEFLEWHLDTKFVD